MFTHYTVHGKTESFEWFIEDQTWQFIDHSIPSEFLMQARKSIFVSFCFLFCFVISIAPVESTMTFKMKQRWAHLIFFGRRWKRPNKTSKSAKSYLKIFKWQFHWGNTCILQEEITNSRDNLLHFQSGNRNIVYFWNVIIPFGNMLC